MVTALRELFANSPQPSHEDKESAVQALTSLLEQAKAIGHAHASDELARSEHAWGGKFVDSLSSAWSIVNTFVQRIADWLTEQDPEEVTEAAIEDEVDALANRVAGYEVASAIEEEVLNVLAVQGVTLMHSITQPGACALCLDRATQTLSINEFVPPPYHAHCRCSSAPANE